LPVSARPDGIRDAPLAAGETVSTDRRTASSPAAKPRSSCSVRVVRAASIVCSSLSLGALVASPRSGDAKYTYPEDDLGNDRKEAAMDQTMAAVVG
jgi:hypothetical protein